MTIDTLAKRHAVLAASIVAAALAGLLFGFDTAVIAGVTHDISRHFLLSPAALGTTVSMALWGTLAGALFAGIPGDRYGSRTVLRVLALFYLAASLGCALSPDWAGFLLFRFACGIAIGGSSVLAPVYIAEIAPPRRRGLLVGLFQLMIVLGILLAYVSNAVVGTLAASAVAWRWKLGVGAGPALIFLMMLMIVPHSPRWLVAKGRIDAARDALARIGATDPAGEATRFANDSPQASGARLSWRRHRRPMILAVLLAVFNQLAGINAVLYYLNDIFAHAGSVSPDRQAILIGVANLIFTLLGMALIDRLGRKTLLLIGAAGMTFCLGSAAAVMFGVLGSALLLPALIGFIAFFATSQGAVIWVYLSEIFPTSVRARGSGLGASTHWLMNAIVAGLFPVVTTYSAGAPFMIFALAMAVQFFVVWRLFPETKGVTLDEMDRLMA